MFSAALLGEMVGYHYLVNVHISPSDAVARETLLRGESPSLEQDKSPRVIFIAVMWGYITRAAIVEHSKVRGL